MKTSYVQHAHLEEFFLRMRVEITESKSWQKNDYFWAQKDTLWEKHNREPKLNKINYIKALKT